MDGSIQQWIQDNTTSNVTQNFLRTLAKLAQNNNDVGRFISGAMALGKFKGKEAFLAELFGVLNGKTEKEKLVKSNSSPICKPKMRKVHLLHLHDESEDEDDYQQNVDKIETNRTPRMGFKKISKSSAAKLKVTAPVSDSLHENDRNSGAPDNTIIPEFKVPSNNNKNITSDVMIHVGAPEIDNLSTASIEDKENDINQDRAWYGNEDSSVALEFEESPSTEVYYKSKTLNVTQPVVQLDSLSISEKKRRIPPFLLSFRNKNGENAIVGAINLSNVANSGLINPIRNPESQFCINSRKGSRLVGMRRLQKDRQASAKHSVGLESSSMGSILGLKNKNLEAKSNVKISSQTHQLSHEALTAVRKTLPAYKVRKELLRCIRDHQVTVVIGETGSGKTTQLAQFLYEDGILDEKMIACTQPRRVAAMSVAKRVAQEMDTELGRKVGYSIRFEDLTSEETRIKFMTDGILLREIMLDPLLERYSCVIMDEAHERSLNTDVLLGIFRTLLTKRRDLKLIVTSATMNADKFSRFFGDSPQFTIPGKTYPVEVIYSKFPVSDYVESAVQTALEIHLSKPISSGDILVFMTGQEDIEVTCESIAERLEEVYAKKYEAKNDSLKDFEVLPIYSSLPVDLQNKIFDRQSKHVRKIVVATNIAETSLTVDGITYVIDCGYSKLKVYNPRIGLDSLRITPISLANANQRSGRAGRTSPGVAYRLYTADSANEDMYPETIPEIQRTNLSNTLLLLKSLNVQDLSTFPFMDPPPIQTLMTSLFELWTLGAVDNFGSLTRFGQLMGSFPLQPSLSKILINSAEFGCSEEVLTIVAMLSVPSIFNRPKERQKESDEARGRFLISQSDHLTLLNVYSQWKANRFSARWCEKHFLQFRSLQRAFQIRSQLLITFEKQGLKIQSSGSDWAIVRKCICSGYANQTAKLSGLGKYVHLKTGMELRIHPTSALFEVGDLPSHVVYHELLMTSQEYISCVTSVDPFWLMEFYGLFYHIRKLPAILQTQAEEGSGGIKFDEIDKTISETQSRIQKKLEQLEKDKVTYELRSEIDHPKRKGEDKDVLVRVGFKKRRPL